MSIPVQVRNSQDMLPVLAEYERQMDAVENRAYHSFERTPASPPSALEPSFLYVPSTHSSEDPSGYNVLTKLSGHRRLRQSIDLRRVTAEFGMGVLRVLVPKLCPQ